MPEDQIPLIKRLTRVPPFDRLSGASLALIEAGLSEVMLDKGQVLFEEGQPLAGLYVVQTGSVDVSTSSGDLVSRRGPGDIMGERGLLRGGLAMLDARAATASTLLLIEASRFIELLDNTSEIARWFDPARSVASDVDEGPITTGLTALQVADLMSRKLVSCEVDHSVTRVAQLMRDRAVSSVLVMKGPDLSGIVTVHDLTAKVLAEGLSGDMPVHRVMTPGPRTIPPSALGLDALIEMASHRINHLPVADADGRIVGMIGKTDVFRRQAATASHMVGEIAAAEDTGELSRIMARLPQMLGHLVAARAKPHAICRRVTDLTDAITRRLLTLAEARLGPPPVPYLWAACGSQGRREQTGVSDQDNCLILDDAAGSREDAYFAELARIVSDGLNEVGFVYCPGDMMATNPRWRQPRHVWRGYFDQWIAEPDTEAQMLASVMFDLRPIAGEASLFHDLQTETLNQARRNSIFVRHMVSNSLKHTPPLGLFRNLSLIRSGEHKNTLDLKMTSVVPVVDLGRVYALQGAIPVVNTRERIVAAGEAGVISVTGARDLLDAYDLIAETRLAHQARRIAEGQSPDNFLAPSELSDLRRTHLRDAFLVVKTMQSALAQGAGGLG